MKKIIISVDHKWRDLPNNVLLKIFLERQGHKVYLIRTGFEEHYVIGVDADLVVMIHLQDELNQDLAKRLRKSGVHVVLMPTEGIPTLDKYRKFSSGVFNDLSGVSIQFVWNITIKNYLRSNKTIDFNKVKVVGCPRFDFYKYPLINILKNKENFCKEYDLNSKLPIVTFATNFTQAQFFYKNREFFFDDASRLGYKKIFNQDYMTLEEVVRNDYHSREIIFEAFIKLVEELRDVNFLLKLHPSEDHQYYKIKFENEYRHLNKRVKLITNQYIWDVLAVTDVLIQRSYNWCRSMAF